MPSLPAFIHPSNCLVFTHLDTCTAGITFLKIYTDIFRSAGHILELQTVFHALGARCKVVFIFPNGDGPVGTNGDALMTFCT